MSIPAAVEALNKEIDGVEKKLARLVSLRDALLNEGSEGDSSVPSSVPARRKPGPKPGSRNKAATAKKATSAKKVAPAKKTAATKATPAKRTMSPEARQRIADAQKKRWAERKGSPKKSS